MLRILNAPTFTIVEMLRLKELILQCSVSHINKITDNSPALKQISIAGLKKESDIALVMRLLENNTFVYSIVLSFDWGKELPEFIEKTVAKVLENPNITHLTLQFTGVVSDKTMRIIAGSHLTDITFNQCKINNNINLLATSDTLTSISDTLTSITNWHNENEHAISQYRELLSNHRLVQLSLQGRYDPSTITFHWIWPESHKHFRLTHLNLKSNNISYDSTTIATLTGFFARVHLQSLNLNETGLTDAALLAFTPYIRDIDEIDISGNSRLTKQGLISFIRQAKCKKMLLDFCEIDDEVFQVICGNPYIEEVSAKTSAKIENLTECPFNTNIKKLDIAYIRGFNTRFIETIAKNLPFLVELHLDNLALSDEVAIAIANNLKKLRVLNFNALRLTRKGVAALATMPALRDLSLYDCTIDRTISIKEELLFLKHPTLTRLFLGRGNSKEVEKNLQKNGHRFMTQKLIRELIPVFNQLAMISAAYSVFSLDILNDIIECLTKRKLDGASGVYRLSQSTMMQRFRREKVRYEENKGAFDSLLENIKQKRPATKIDMFTLRRLSGLFSMKELGRLCLKKRANTNLNLFGREVTNREVAALMQVLDENEMITDLDLRENNITDVGKDMLVTAGERHRIKIQY